MARRRLTASQSTGRLMWMLTVEYAGRVFRWSSEPCVVPDDGDSIPFDGGLSPVELEDEFAGSDQEPDELSLSFDLFFPVDVALLEAQGYSLSGSRAEVSLWPLGDEWADRRVVLDGFVVEPEIGDESEPVAFSVESAPFKDAAVIPHPAAVIAEVAFVGDGTYTFNDDVTTEVVGLAYPTVFGTPGWYSRGPVEKKTSGSPGLVVWVRQSAVTFALENNWILLAGHHVGATAVTVYWDDGTTAGVAVSNTTDSLGRKVALAYLGYDTAAGTIGDASEYWVCWDSVAGALQNATGTGPLELAGDVCEYFLTRTTLQVDRGAWAAAKPYLNRYRLAGYFDEQVSPWEWLADNVLPLLPVDIRTGPRGLYPVVWRLDAKPEDCVATWTEGEQVTRLSPIRTGSMDRIVNDLRINYALRARKGTYRRNLAVNGAPVAGSEERPNYFAQVSHSRYGRRSKVIETDVVYDDATAGLIAAWTLAAYALPTKKVTYQADASHGWVQPGDPVLLTDASLHLTERVALVQQVKWLSESAVEVALWITESPPRDSRPTS